MKNIISKPRLTRNPSGTFGGSPLLFEGGEHFVVDCLTVELVPEEQLLEERLPNSSAGDVGDYSVRAAGCSRRHYRTDGRGI